MITTSAASIAVSVLGPHSHADVGLRQRGSVVDAVAVIAVRPCFAGVHDCRQFVPPATGCPAHRRCPPSGNARRRCHVIAGQHHRRDTEAMQFGKRLPKFLDAIGNGEDRQAPRCRRRTINCPPLAFMDVEPTARSPGCTVLLFIEAMIAQHQRPAIDLAAIPRPGNALKSTRPFSGRTALRRPPETKVIRNDWRDWPPRQTLRTQVSPKTVSPVATSRGLPSVIVPVLSNAKARSLRIFEAGVALDQDAAPCCSCEVADNGDRRRDHQRARAGNDEGPAPCKSPCDQSQ